MDNRHGGLFFEKRIDSILNMHKGPRTKSRTKSGPGGSPMYTKEEREGILWEFRQSGLSVPEACRRLPLFPTRANLYRWLRMEEAGELAATEMPDR